MLVLESASHAAARRAKVYARIDGWHAGRFGRGAPAWALHDAWKSLLQKVGRAPDRLGVISAVAGGANRPHELAEQQALAAFCDDRAVRARIFAARSMVGEGEAWATALQVAMAAHVLREGKAPPTWNLAPDAPRRIAQSCCGGAIEGTAALVSGLDVGGAYSAMHLSRP